MAENKRLIFSLPDEQFDRLDELSEKHDVSISSILKLGILRMVLYDDHHGKLWNNGEVILRKRKSS